jgi:RNA polymerase sigma factor (sigma-70 family)
VVDVTEHVDWARQLARRETRGWPRFLREDAEGDALEALVWAGREYDEAHEAGATFKTFAYYRVKGAVVDGLRAWTRGRYERQRVALVDLGEVGEHDSYVNKLPATGAGTDPGREILDAAELRSLAARIERLPDPLRAVAALRLGGATLRQIGDVMGYTESRACQLQREVRRRLAAVLQS